MKIDIDQIIDMIFDENEFYNKNQNWYLYDPDKIDEYDVNEDNPKYQYNIYWGNIITKPHVRDLIIEHATSGKKITYAVEISLKKKRNANSK